MNKQIRFQEKLKNQILKTAFITLTALLVFFYLSAYLFLGYYNNSRLENSNHTIENRLIQLLETTEKYNYIFLGKNSINSTDVFYSIYQLNKEADSHFEVLMMDPEGEITFNTMPETVNASFLQYISILKKKLDIHHVDYISIHLNKKGYFLSGVKNESGYSITIMKSDDLESYMNHPQFYLIMDDSKQVIVTNRRGLADTLNRFHFPTSDELTVDGQQYVWRVQSTKNNLRIISFILKQNILDMRIIFLLIILVGIFVTLLLNRFSNQISKKSSESLYLLMKEIENIKNEKYLYLHDINTNDEFDTLSEEINSMLRSINHLNEKNTELLGLNKQIEMKQLESQFNPHFLYNTLETIRYVMYMDQNQATDLIVKLTSILRYSISNKEEIVPLQRDISYIENYLEICKIRFQERFHYTLKIEDECRNLMIPKLILQPVIENSIKHNFKTKSSLNIWVTIELIDSKLTIEVEDDGDGIDVSTLEQLDFEKSVNTTNHVGLHNVYRRLQLRYGKDLSFGLYSKLGIGTKVSFAIPIQAEEQNV